MSFNLSDINKELHTAAAERRSKHPSRPHLHTSKYTAFDHNHHKRTTFRRLLETILRSNCQLITVEACEILHTLSQNIISCPAEERFRSFRHNNSSIKKYLIEPKGTLEYAIAMGFSSQVKGYEAHYVFDQTRLTDLCIGNAILQGRLKEVQAGIEREDTAFKRNKSEKCRMHEKVMQHYMDDRKTVAIRSQNEREGLLAAQRSSPAGPKQTFRPLQIRDPSSK